MLTICNDFANEYDVIFNSSKSKLLFFGNVGHRPRVSIITFFSSTMELVSNDKHLGNAFSQIVVQSKFSRILINSTET